MLVPVSAVLSGSTNLVNLVFRATGEIAVNAVAWSAAEAVAQRHGPLGALGLEVAPILFNILRRRLPSGPSANPNVANVRLPRDGRVNVRGTGGTVGPVTQGVGSRVVRTTGADSRGPYTRLDVGSGDHALETTLRGHVLEVDWVQGENALFNLGEVQAAAGGPGSIRTITGFVTDQLAVNVQQAGYVQRLADIVSRRLGGQWTARLETTESRTYLILELVSQ